jgi:hypothetical protein
MISDAPTSAFLQALPILAIGFVALLVVGFFLGKRRFVHRDPSLAPLDRRLQRVGLFLFMAALVGILLATIYAWSRGIPPFGSKQPIKQSESRR